MSKRIWVWIYSLLSLLAIPVAVWYSGDHHRMLCVFLLMLNAVVVCIIHLKLAVDQWNEMREHWQRALLLAYGLISLFFVLILLSPKAVLVAKNRVDNLLSSLISFLFLLIIGIAILLIGHRTDEAQANGKPERFLTIFRITGALLMGIGVLQPLLMLFGNPSPCYCPVTRKKTFGDILRKPIYHYRKSRLVRRLCLKKRFL